MDCTTLDLKPDRLLMDSNFDGYKLSLEKLSFSRQTLETPVAKILLDPTSSGLLHAKLFGLHNYLFADQFDDFQSVYFSDKNFNIQKIYIDNITKELVSPIQVFTIPMLKEKESSTGVYNITLKFASTEYAVLSDGMGNLFILATKDKNDDDSFELLYSASGLLSKENHQGFIVFDALFNSDKNELHTLLLHIQEDEASHFQSIIHWITFKSAEDGRVWEQTSMRKLKSKGEIQYLYLENNCEHIYVVSDGPVEFLLNSEYPIVIETPNEAKDSEKDDIILFDKINDEKIGQTFNSQQIEDCDFETDKSGTFVRISRITNKITHRIHLGSHQVILTSRLSPKIAPAIGIRLDVDLCLWQPTLENDEIFSCKHQGTLLAFGYVQASKTNRKFIASSPDLDYSIISESLGHIFIYRQNRPLLATTDLRNRTCGGRRIKSMAEQKVFHLPNQDVLGIFPNKTHLFILGENFVMALKIN